ncbi:MAG: hypothetical protein HYX97_02815 [Chloroflexi bacterium]|nr:hypothetical protein [Chloroflexota bacterium]
MLRSERGQTVVYPNKYYEKDIVSGEATTYYYLGSRLMALRKASTLEYIHQDHLTGTAASTDSSGATVSTIKYLPFGATRSSTGTLGTDRKFTGQRLDSGGLYFYGARYYDAAIGRFVSADDVVPDYRDPQSLNRYSYTVNNPLRYTDPTGRHHRDAEVAGAQFVIATLPSSAVPEVWVRMANIINDNNFEHQMEQKFGGTLAELDRHTSVSTLDQGTVIVVSSEQTAIQVSNPQASATKRDPIRTTMTFDNGEPHNVSVDVTKSQVPPGADAFTISRGRIVFKDMESLTIGLLVHESEHIQQRVTWWGWDWTFSAAYGLSRLIPRGVDASMERAAYRTRQQATFWVVKPK